MRLLARKNECEKQIQSESSRSDTTESVVVKPTNEPVSLLNFEIKLHCCGTSAMLVATAFLLTADSSMRESSLVVLAASVSWISSLSFAASSARLNLLVVVTAVAGAVSATSRITTNSAATAAGFAFTRRTMLMTVVDVDTAVTVY